MIKIADIPPPTQLFDANWIGSFVQNNLIVLVVIGLCIFLAFTYLKVSSRTPKIISRSDIEKKKRIDELQPNSNTITEYKLDADGRTLVNLTKYNDLFYGVKYLGKITNIGNRLEYPEIAKKKLSAKYEDVKKIINNPDTTFAQADQSNKEYEQLKIEIEQSADVIYELVYRPVWFMNFTNPFKIELLRIFKSSLIMDRSKGQLVINPTVSIDKKGGFYYDVPNEKRNLNWINESIHKHDYEDLASFYFVESQKRATLDLSYAHEMAMKEKDLQVELARKRGKMSSI